jgi:hypothetical protein
MKLPTTAWREQKAEEARKFAAGEITAAECYMDKLFPDPFIDRTGLLLQDFAAAISRCSPTAAGFPPVMQHIQNVVLALNNINQDFDHRVIETGEREALCEFIDAVIIEQGIDIDALAASQNCTRYELTDEWRDW